MIYLISNENNIINHEICKKASINDLLYWLKNKNWISVDSETEGYFDFNNRVLCLQIGNFEDQFIVDCITVSETNVQIALAILENPGVCKIFQNAKFDLKFFKYFFGVSCVSIYDTLLAECILTSGIESRKLGLDYITKKYLNIELDKSIRSDIKKNGLTDAVIKYAADDVKYLGLIRDKQVRLIEQYCLKNCLRLENEVVSIFADMELNGIRLDSDRWKTVAFNTKFNSEKLIKELDSIIINESKLNNLYSSNIQRDLFEESSRLTTVNWNSPKQILILIKALGVDAKSTSERFLFKYRNKHKLISVLLKYKKQAKLSNSFGINFLKFINPVTKKIHTDYWQIVNTGRVSSNTPNLQQIPARTEEGKKMRSCFIPDKGNVIVQGDYAGIELCLIAEGSQDPLWIKIFNNKEDIHGKLACELFNIPEDKLREYTDFKPDVTYRDIQKTINYGLSYGMSEHKLSDIIDIPVNKSKELINAFFKVVPSVKNYLIKLGNFGKKHGYSRTFSPFGRIRWYESQKAWNEKDYKLLGSIERQSKNHPIQGSSADMIKLALYKINKCINENNYPIKILLTVHDEIITECSQEFAEEWCVIMKNIMEDTGKIFIKSVPVTCDIKISKKWTK